MKNILILLGILVFPLASAQDFAIDDYLFRWVVMSVGETDFRVMKDEERSYINVYRTNGLISVAARMPASDAIAVGEVLARTQEFFEAQQGSSDNVAERVEAGNFTVTFRTSVFAGFTVVIQENSRTSNNAVTLSREEAIGIQPELLRANDYIAFLESQFSF
ncbi:MAG: hypothetical protein KJN90_14785 [Gammaproteobacteria bacterium]|nr:hypothetical protein [Gammaproteobacteria bacterium]